MQPSNARGRRRENRTYFFYPIHMKMGKKTPLRRKRHLRGESELLVCLTVLGDDGTVNGAEDRTDGGTVDVVALAHPEGVLSVGGLQVDVAHGLRVGAGGDGMLGVIHKVEFADLQLRDGVEEGVDGAVALAGDLSSPPL